MSTSPGELNRFLADLSVRRQRLLSLVSDEDGAGLVEELLELSEQLLVADEELRVQQEQLESTRARMESLAIEWTAMFESSTAALVLTDASGVVLQATRPAAQLVLQPAARRTPRPIATWFDVEDRSRVRGLISQRSLGRPLVLHGASLRRSDGSTVTVDVRVTPTSSSAHDQPVLSWELTPSDAPGLRLVTGDDDATSVLPDLAPELTEMVRRLASVRGLEAMLAAVGHEAVRLVPGAAHAVVLTQAGGTDVLSATPGAPTDLDEGISVPLPHRGAPTAELRLLAAPSQPFGPAAYAAADLVGVHLQVAVDRAAQQESFARALESRQQIGQAVGILVERRRITPDDAFTELVRRSQAANIKLREVARFVVETGLDPERIRSR